MLLRLCSLLTLSMAQASLLRTHEHTLILQDSNSNHFKLANITIPVIIYSPNRADRRFVDNFKSVVVIIDDRDKLIDAATRFKKSLAILHRLVIITNESDQDISDWFNYHGKLAHSMLVTSDINQLCIEHLLRAQSGMRELLACSMNDAVKVVNDKTLEGMDVIRVSNFRYPPFTLSSTEGIEVNLVTTIAKSLGKEVQFANPKDGGMWGSW